VFFEIFPDSPYGHPELGKYGRRTALGEVRFADRVEPVRRRGPYWHASGTSSLDEE